MLRAPALRVSSCWCNCLLQILTGRISKCCLLSRAAAYGMAQPGVLSSHRLSTPLKRLQIMYFSSAIPSSQLSSGLILQLGTALFLVGTLGNAYHHYLLSTLRSKAEVQQKKRKVMAHQFCLHCFIAANPAAPHSLLLLLLVCGFMLQAVPPQGLPWCPAGPARWSVCSSHLPALSF